MRNLALLCEKKCSAQCVKTDIDGCFVISYSPPNLFGDRTHPQDRPSHEIIGVNRFFLAEPSLTSVSGHCWSYLRSLIEPVRHAGFEPVLLGHRNVDPRLARRENIVPIFERWCDERIGDHETTLAAHRRSIRADLTRISKRHRIGSQDFVLINTLRHWALAGVVDWLESMRPRSRPRVALVLHFTAQSDPNGSAEMRPFYEEAFVRIERSPSRDCIRLLADSEELIDEYRDINDRLDFHLAPIPHIPHLPDRDHEPASKLNVGYIGEARENKGFQLLPHVVRRASEHASAVHFHIHSFCHDPQSIFYRQAIAGLRGPHVTLYPEKLDDDEYTRFLDALDIVILPYTLHNYHSQTSGVFAEAMAMGKSVIVPRGSWMARQVNAYGGGATFNPGDPEDLARQVLSFVNDGLKCHGAAERAARWAQFHNPANLLNLLLSPAAHEGAKSNLSKPATSRAL